MLIGARVIMPVAYAVTRLPRFGNDLIRCATLYIPCEGLLLVFSQNLAKHHASGVLIIEMCSDLQSAVAEGIERQHGDIEINEIGVIAIDGIEGAVVEVGDEFLRWRTSTVRPVPLAMNLTVVPRAVAQGVVLGIEVLGVEAFPPFALAVCFRQFTIVIDACLWSVLIVSL